jgi:hypothetical protein
MDGKSNIFSGKYKGILYKRTSDVHIQRRLASMSFVLVYIYWGSSVLGDVERRRRASLC